MHSLFIVAEIHEVEPAENGWAQYEATGRACVVCPCGLDTGFIDKAEAAERYREHAEANPPRAAVRIHPETGEASEVLHDMLGEVMKEG